MDGLLYSGVVVGSGLVIGLGVWLLLAIIEMGGR